MSAHGLRAARLYGAAGVVLAMLALAGAAPPVPADRHKDDILYQMGELPGAQSALLEASGDERPAFAYAGTMTWGRGEIDGLPVIIGRAVIPTRGLTIELTIRQNRDAALPASHILEIEFEFPHDFVGGAVAGIPGILVKDESALQGRAIEGASARVVGNSFLYAVSAAASDGADAEQLMLRRFIDLAILYRTGKRAIVTLKKDEAAVQLFDQVFRAWDDPLRSPLDVVEAKG